MKRYITIFLLILLPLFLVAEDLPELTGRVNDYAGMLSSSERSELSTLLQSYEMQTGHQLVICTVETTGDLPIEMYSIELAEKWKIGSEERDDGVIILVALSDRKMRIEVGYGLEGDLTDFDAKMIIEDIMKPSFQAGDYYNGLKGAAVKIALETGFDPSSSEISPDYKDYSKTSTNIFKSNKFKILGGLCFVLGLILNFLLRGLIFGAGGRGVTKFIFLIYLGIVLLNPIFWFIILLRPALQSLFFLYGITFAGFIVAFPGRGGGGGSSSFGSGGFSSGGGGFSGGGGSFGGGGASGSW